MGKVVKYMEKQKEYKVRLRDWAPLIRNSYQKKVNPEETGSDTEQVKDIEDKKGSSDKHKEYVITLFNNYLSALGVIEYSSCFKGGEDKDGKKILKNSYAFFEEDKELVIGLLNAEENETKEHISKGEFDKCRLEILEHILQKMQKLFEKYYPDKEELEYINQVMKNMTRIDVFRQMEIIKAQIMNIENNMLEQEDVYNSAGFRIGTEDYICWNDFFCKVLGLITGECISIYKGMNEYRSSEFDEKLARLSEKEREILNQYVTDKQDKLNAIGIEISPDQKPYILNKDDVKNAKKKEQMNKIFEESSGEAGEKLFNDLISGQSSKEILHHVFLHNIMNLEWKLTDMQVNQEESEAITGIIQADDNNLMKLIMESIFLSLKI